MSRIHPLICLLLGAILLLPAALFAGARERLLRAIMFGDAQKTAAAIRDGADVNTVDPSGSPAFLLLKYTGNTNVALVLISNKVNWKACDKNGCDMLHYAAEFGYTDLARILLDLGLDPDQPCLSGETALHRAAKAGRYAVAKLLVEHGANPDLADKEQKTPLFVALKAEQLDVAALLLYVDLHLETTNTNTAEAVDTILLKAARDGKKNIVRFLVDKKLPLTAKDENGRSALYTAVAERHPDVAELLLAGGADPNAAAQGGWTPLHAAAWKSDGAMVSLLLSNRASPTNTLTDKGVEGFTPLHVAAWKGNLSAASNLADAGTGIDTPDSAGRPPLWHAVTRGDTAMASFLLSRGANPLAAGTNRLSLLDLASNLLKIGGKKAKETYVLLKKYAADARTNVRTNASPVAPTNGGNP
jgi:ankyrin repeat protein